MKRYTKLLPILITLGFIMLFFIPSVNGFDDIEYTFQKDSLYTNLDINNQFNETFNLREQTYYDFGNYPATYSFTNETDDTESTDIDFVDVDNSGANTLVSIISEISNHKKVLSLYDNSNPNAVAIENNLSNEPFGTIEFWLRTTDAEKTSLFQVQEEFALFGMRIITDKFQVFRVPAGWTDLGLSAFDDIWYHISFDFESTNGGYEGLAQYEFRIRVNSEVFGDFDYANDLPFADSILLGTGGVGSNYYSYFDAIGIVGNKFDAIYTFDDDTIGQEPLGWTSNNDGSCTTLISAIVGSRTEVLNLNDGSAVGICNISTDIFFDISESIVLYFRTDTVSLNKDIYLTFKENNSDIIRIRIHQGNIQGTTDEIGSWIEIKNGVINVNIWYKFEIILVNDQAFAFWLDDVEQIDFFDTDFTPNLGIDKIELFTTTSTSGYNGYFDNIGEFLLPSNLIYIIGSNIIPLTIETDYLEVDKFTFNMDSINSLYSFGYHAIVSSFSANEVDGGTAEVISAGGALQDFNNRLMDLEVIDITDGAVISKSNINDTSEFIDVSYDFLLKGGTNNDAFIDFLVLSYPNPIADMVVKLRIDFSDMTLYLYDDEGSIIKSLKDNLVLDVNYTIELKVNYEIDTCLSYFYQESVLIDSDSFELLSLDETGLYSVICDLRSDDDSAQVYLDNIGIYANSRSLSSDFGYSSIKFGATKQWNSEKNNIFKYESNGTFHFMITQGSFYAVGANNYLIKGLSVYNDTETIINTYGAVENRGSPLGVFTVQGNDFKLESLSIEGVYLKEGANEYYLEFESGGVNQNESYFFVDSSNNLRFIHISNKEGINEFIQAKFDIQNRDSTDTAISFYSNKDSTAFGFFRVNYTSTSLVMQIENTFSTKRVLLESGKTIHSFIILISDTNKDYVHGTTEGLVSDILLFDIEDSIATVVSLNLIDMLIPLIIILIPTLSISKLYGDFLVVPLFVMFSLILAITSLIPIWLFFVILVSSSLFIFFEKDKKVVF